MTVPARIGIVTLGVRDLARSRAFYGSLGWEPCSSSTDGICWFATTGSYLGLFPLDELAADAKVDAPATRGFGGITLAMNLETEEAVTAALAEAERAGAAILKPAERTDWGGFSGYFADPDGYPWEVARNPFFPLDDEGRLTIP